jgi:hypothetical protein
LFSITLPIIAGGNAAVPEGGCHAPSIQMAEPPAKAHWALGSSVLLMLLFWTRGEATLM